MAFVRRVQCAGTMVGLLSPTGVLGSPQPAWEALSHVFLARSTYCSFTGMWQMWKKKPHIIHLSLLQPHSPSMCTPAHSHFSVCNADRIFSLRCRDINFLLIPLRPAPLLFLSPLACWNKEQRVWFTLKHTYPLPEMLGSWQ